MANSDIPFFRTQQIIYDAVVLGAGVSGLASARILLGSGGLKSVAVIDSYDRLGGNHIDVKINDFTFDVGSFIFHDNSQFLHMFPELLTHYKPVDIQIGRITPDGGVHKYPFSIKSEIIKQNSIEKFRIFSSLIFSKMKYALKRNAAEYAKYYIGEYLFKKSGLADYMLRFYNVPPESIDIGFANSRMKWMRNTASVRKVVTRLVPRQKHPTLRALVRPRSVFAPLYDIAKATLEQAGAAFYLGSKVTRISKDGDVFIIDMKSHRVFTKRVISTIPIRDALQACELADEFELDSVPLKTLFFSFKGHRNFTQAILYNFTQSGRWKRLTMHSDVYGLADEREFFSAEINDLSGDSTEELEADFRRHIAEFNFFNGDLKLEGHHKLDYAYPVVRHGTLMKARVSIDRLKAFGVETFGRQGGFDYLPSANVTVVNAKKHLGFAP